MPRAPAGPAAPRQSTPHPLCTRLGCGWAGDLADGGRGLLSPVNMQPRGPARPPTAPLEDGGCSQRGDESPLAAGALAFLTLGSHPTGSGPRKDPTKSRPERDGPLWGCAGAARAIPLLCTPILGAQRRLGPALCHPANLARGDTGLRNRPHPRPLHSTPSQGHSLPRPPQPNTHPRAPGKAARGHGVEPPQLTLTNNSSPLQRAIKKG